MSENVPKVPVGTVAAHKGLIGGPFGSSLGKKDYVSSGIPVVRGQNLSGPGRFRPADFVYVSREKAFGELSRNLACPGDVVFTQRGTLGQVGLIPDDADDVYVISQSQMRLRVDPTKADALYIYYCFRDPEMVARIQSRAIVTGVPHINLAILGELPIPLPPLVKQRAIAEVLGALDDKIEASRRVADSCDALWQTVAAEVFDDIEDGQVASGDFQPLSSLADFVNGKAFTKNATGTGRMVVRIAELNSGPGASTIYNEIEVPAEHTATPGDLLFAWSGSLTVQRWYRPEAIINQHIFKVVPRSKIPMWCVHAHLLRLLPAFQRIAAGKATTMGHIQRHDLDVEVGVPNGDMLARLDRVCAPLWHRALRAEKETLVLARLRDALLSKLVSGELQVRGDDIAALMEVSG